ncbi:hypothetical protein AB0436_10040 [Streptomyces sp. NPDC051322]|uniref:hypothetical protein n=1 Tax=Streptomyces sp. NPDC051322 TaxID=3154645 RepID=UPI00344B6E34
MTARRNQRPEAPDSTADESDRLRDEEKAGRAEVRTQARGLTHHQVKAAFKEAQSQLPEDPADDEKTDGAARARAELEEWRRIARLLADQAGPYDPDTDAFLQGELAAEADREAAERGPRRSPGTGQHSERAGTGRGKGSE